jgi:hypothetical protein
MFTNVFHYSSEVNNTEKETIIIVSFSNNKILFFVLSESQPFYLLRIDEYEIESSLSDIDILSKEFSNIYLEYLKTFTETKKVNICFSVDYYTLIPEELFKENEKKSYLEFLYGEEKIINSQIEVSVIHSNNTSVLLSVTPEWQKKCVEFIDKKVIQNQVYSYISKVLANENKRGIFVNVYDNNFDIVIKDEIIKYINRFEFETAKDFSYFIVGLVKTIEWNSFDECIYFSGNIMEESELINIIKRYFKEITFLKNGDIKSTEDIKLHIYFNQL